MEISFDKESAVASIFMRGWAPALVKLLSRYFDVVDSVLTLDYSHLSSEGTGQTRAWTMHRASDREHLEAELQTAAGLGPIATTIKMLGLHDDGVNGSASIKDPEAYLSADEAFKTEVLGDKCPALRDAILAEIEPGPIWVNWLLHRYSSHRSRYLGDEQMMHALVSRTPPEQCLQSLWLVHPHSMVGSWAFDELIERHTELVYDFLREHIDEPLAYGRSEALESVLSLFEKSQKVQASREACELVLERAHRSSFPRLIQHCHAIREEDVAKLFWRWFERPKEEKEDEFSECVTAAFETLSKNSKNGVPSSLLFAAAWHGFTDLHETGRAEVFASLRLLPTSGYDRNSKWEQLNPSAREAWREALFDALISDSELAQGLMDFACLWLDQVAFAEVEPVLLRLMEEPNHFQFAAELAGRGPLMMRLRAKGLTRSSQGALDLRGTSLKDEATIPSVGAKTWLGDPSVERIIHTEISGVEAEFCNHFSQHWGEDEEVHTGRLIEWTARAIESANTRLKQHSSTTRGAYPSLNVRVRQPGKREEGERTAAGASLGADVLFLTRVVDKGTAVVERATLVQVKKRGGTQIEGSFSSTVPFDSQQCANMLKQTEYSYYLIITPPSARAALWVLPARLVGNLSQMHTSRSSVPVQQARDASCSFADFFLYGLIGLWAGDERGGIVAIADGDPGRGRRPRLIVEIEIRRQPS